jgi:hypothetical protein
MNEDTMICGHCGQEFNMGYLTQLFAHEMMPHRPIKQIKYSGSRKITSKLGGV